MEKIRQNKNAVQKTKILILEDSPVFRESFLEFSKKHSFHIVGFSQTTADFLTQVKEKKPQVAILDLVIPKENVLNLIGVLRKRYPKLPLIACSSLTEDFIVNKALQAGCFDYIFKPFKEKDLLDTIKQAVS